MSGNAALSGHATCWLEVQLMGNAFLFEFSPRCDTSVVVGSVQGAEIAIDVPGVPAVAFHFERERDAIVVVPGYHSRPRVNTIVATGPVAVGTHAAIELPGVALEAWLHWERPTHLQLSVRSNVMADHSGYLARLPADDQTTSLAVERFGDGAQQHTEVMRPVRFESNASGATSQRGSPGRTEPLGVPALQPETPLVSTGVLSTEVMAPVRFAPRPVVARPAEKTPVLDPPTAPARVGSRNGLPGQHAATPVVPSAIVTLGAAPSAKAVASQFLSTPDTGIQLTTAFDLAALPADMVGPSRPANSPPPSATPTPAPPANQPALGLEGTVAQRATAVASKGIAWLGTHTKQSPVLVLTSAAVATAVILFALLGISHLMAPRTAASQSPGPARSSPSASNPGPAPSASPPLGGVTPQGTSLALPLPSDLVPPPTRPIPPGRKTHSPSPVRVAAGHLASGRYDDAERSYATLATVHPEAPAYRVIVALLRARTKAQCAATSSAPACPEVRP